MTFPEAMNRMFSNVHICMKCNAKNRSGKLEGPRKCRKCGTVDKFRLKNAKSKKRA